MRVVVTGGGSGGHVYPAIAIADKFREMDPDGEILYIGYLDGFEKRVVPKAGYKMAEIDTRWVDRSSIKEMGLTAYHVGRGIIQAGKVLRRFKPDVIIGTGGFVCFPVIFAGHRQGIPCYIHEQNAFPGLANRRLEKYVRKVFLGFEEGGEYFSDKNKLVVTGNPVRRSFYEIKKSDAREKLGFKESDFVVLSFGGSLGAEAINEIALGLLEDMNGREGQILIFGTGRWYYDDVMDELKRKNIVPESNIRIMNYIDDIDNYIAASDLIISRSGALSVAETLVAGKPSILVPSPNVTGNHQYFNAKAVADKGGAILIEENDADIKMISDRVKRLMETPDVLTEMGQNARGQAPGQTTQLIYDEIIKNMKQ